MVKVFVSTFQHLNHTSPYFYVEKMVNLYITEVYTLLIGDKIYMNTPILKDCFVYILYLKFFMENNIKYKYDRLCKSIRRYET